MKWKDTKDFGQKRDVIGLVFADEKNLEEKLMMQNWAEVTARVSLGG